MNKHDETTKNYTIITDFWTGIIKVNNNYDMNC